MCVCSHRAGTQKAKTWNDACLESASVTWPSSKDARSVVRLCERASFPDNPHTKARIRRFNVLIWREACLNQSFLLDLGLPSQNQP
jgi:hypothetical protein